MAAGLYTITHKASGKFYLGSSVNTVRRWRQHRSDLNKNRHKTPPLQAAWNKYGEDAFEFDVIMTCHPDLVFWYEAQFLKELQPYFNIDCDLKETGTRKMTDETKGKISQRAKERYAKQGPPMHAAKLNKSQVREIKRLIASEEYWDKEIASMFGVSESTINLIHQGKRWKGVTV